MAKELKKEIMNRSKLRTNAWVSLLCETGKCSFGEN